MSSMFDVLFPLVIAVVIAIGIAAAVQHRNRKRDLQKLLARDPNLRATSAPCGLGTDLLHTMFSGLPKGDRRYGVDWGVTGPQTVSVDGRDSDIECAAFQWWWERRNTDSKGRTSYSKQRRTAVLARLPQVVHPPIVLSPESALGRLGITRGGQQLESSEFNRRFRVESRDAMLTVKLLDPGLQELLLTEFPGRGVEFIGDLLLLTGKPQHRDGSLSGVIGELPAVRQDVTRLVGAVPSQFWRAVAASGEGSR